MTGVEEAVLATAFGVGLIIVITVLIIKVKEWGNDLTLYKRKRK